MNETQIIACISVLVAIVLDFVLGFAKASMNKSISSSIMRKGLYHKFAEIMLLALAVLLYYLAEHVNLGIEIPMVEASAVYLVLMELLSCLENIKEINPNLADNPLFKILETTKGGSDEQKS